MFSSIFVFAQQLGSSVPSPPKTTPLTTDTIATIAMSILIPSIAAGVAHLKMVWDIRSDLRHGLDEIKSTREDVDQIKDDVNSIKLRDVDHEARIAALERSK